MSRELLYQNEKLKKEKAALHKQVDWLEDRNEHYRNQYGAESLKVGPLQVKLKDLQQKNSTMIKELRGLRTSKIERDRDNSVDERSHLEVHSMEELLGEIEAITGTPEEDSWKVCEIGDLLDKYRTTEEPNTKPPQAHPAQR